MKRETIDVGDDPVCVQDRVDRCRVPRGKTLPFTSAVVPPRNLSSSFSVRSNFYVLKLSERNFTRGAHFFFYTEFNRV